MSREGKSGQSDTVLEGRHLLGVFFAVVVLCAIFFTLGFVLGRNQATQQAAKSPSPGSTQQQPSAPTEPQARDLTFYDRVEKPQPAENLPRGEPSETKPAAPATAPKPAAATGKPIYLQVAAVSREADAKRLMAELRKMGFDSEIRPPKEDRLYRVMVGPLANDELATAAQHRLEAQGFRSILRR
ncbi:MAG TPA: SPOR domain-containing protein [Candidatus Xenobia bacterium]|nr:SPOR domain-containing protein [Candidatus Xenobia bacterium]